MARAICGGGEWGGCGRVFTSTVAFDTHRTGTFARSRGHGLRRCMSEAEMAAADLVIHPAKRAADGPIWALEVSLHRGEVLRAIQRKGMSKYGQSRPPRTSSKSGRALLPASA